MNKIAYRSLRVALLLLAALICNVAGADGANIRLGQSLALSGPIAEIGAEFRDGALSYFKWVNSKGGVHGRRIDLISLDDGYDPARTVDNVKKLLDQENVLALFGILGTGNYAAVLPTINARSIPSFAPYNGSDDLRRQPSPTTFWLRASYGDEAEKIVDQLTTLGINRIAVFYQDDAFGKGGLAVTEAALAKRKLKVVASGTYDKARNDVGAAAKTIAAVSPQAVVMFSTYKPTAAFVRAMRALKQQPQFFALSIVGFKTLQAELGPDAAGIAIAQVMPYPYSGLAPVSREFEALPKEMKPAQGATYAVLEGFVAAKIMTEALRRAGAQLTRERLLAALESLHPYDAGGIEVDYGNGRRLGSSFVEVTIVGNSGHLLR